MRTVRQGGNCGKIVENDFVEIVNGWIDQLVDCHSDNMVLRFLIRLAIGKDNFEHFGSVRVSVCVRYLLGKLFTPMLKLIETIKSGQEVSVVKEGDIFDMKLVEFLSDDDYMSIPLVFHWMEMDYFNSLIPRQYFIWIVQYLSKIKTENQVNAAVWTCDFLETTLGFQVTDMVFINDRSRRNFVRVDFIPKFATKFCLQFLALWIGNLDLVKWCLEHRSANGTNRIDTLLRTGSQLGETPTEYSIVSSYGSCYKTDALGLTILHYAVQGKQLEIVKLLIQKYRANPFYGGLISSAQLAYRMHLLSGNDSVCNDIFELLKYQYKEHLERHIDSNKGIYDESNVKIFDLDETEEDDFEKLRIDKGNVNAPLRLHKYLEEYDAGYVDMFEITDSKHLLSSDEEEDEEFLDINIIRSESKKTPTTDSKDPWVLVTENENELDVTLNNLLKDTEHTEQHIEQFSHYDRYSSVYVGERVDLNEKFKKRLLEEVNDAIEFEPKFKKRKEMTIPKHFFNQLAKHILGDYRMNTFFTPSSQAIMQEKVECLCVELFKIISEIGKFLVTDLLTKEQIALSFNSYCGKEFIFEHEENVKSHLSSLSIEISPEQATSLVTEIKEHNFLSSVDYDSDSDPDYSIEFEDETDRINFGIGRALNGIEKKKEEGSGYESDYSDESEIGFEVFNGDHFVFYPSSISEIEQERELSELVLGKDQYEIKYESVNRGGENGYLVYSRDVHLIKRLIAHNDIDQDLLNTIGYELFFI